jgi:hypothetical protein
MIESGSQALLDKIMGADLPEEGFYPRSEWEKRFNKSASGTRALLSKAVASGIMEKRTYKVLDNGVYCIKPHYKEC